MSDVIISKETLLKGHLPEDTVEIEGVGLLRVRGLSRLEVLSLADMDSGDREVHALVCGLVDPALTAAEVREWQAVVTSPVCRVVHDEILMLSGLINPQKAVGDAKRSFQEEHGP